MLNTALYAYDGRTGAGTNIVAIWNAKYPTTPAATVTELFFFCVNSLNKMSTGAIIMMIVSLALVWGGLVYSLIRLPKEE